MTAEQLHDALGLLPSDLIEETDVIRSRPPKTVIVWKRWAAMAACFVLVLGCGLMAMRLLPGGGSMDKMATAECAPEAPAAAAPTEAAVQDRDEAANDSSAQIAQDIGDNTKGEAPAEEEAELPPTGYPADGAYFLDISMDAVYRTDLKPDISACVTENQGALFCTLADMNAYFESAEALCELGNLTEALEAYDKAWFESHDLLVIRAGTERSEWVPCIQDVILTGPESCEITLATAVLPEDNSPDPACWHILLPVEKGLLVEGMVVEVRYA